MKVRIYIKLVFALMNFMGFVKKKNVISPNCEFKVCDP